MYNINDNYMMYGSWNMERQEQNFLSFGTVFCPFTHLMTRKVKIKILKKMKKTKQNNTKNVWRYYYFTQVYRKWRSYDVWFLRSWAWRTEFFFILDHFFPFYPTNNPKNQNFEYHFTLAYHKWQSHDVRLLSHGARRIEFFVILDHLLLFYP